MPSRVTPLISGQIYHIYNRGVEKRWIFEDARDYKRLLKTLTYYQFAGPKPKLSHYFQYQNFKPELSVKIVEIVAYCLMPNHFHLMLKQVAENAITEMLSKTSLSYTKYFNTKYKRVGPLFQGEFKAVLVESDEQLMHLSRYIHLNPIASFLAKDLQNYPWSSYKEYINRETGICSKSMVLDLFPTSQYEQFVLDQIDYSQSLEMIKHQIVEEI